MKVSRRSRGWQLLTLSTLIACAGEDGTQPESPRAPDEPVHSQYGPLGGGGSLLFLKDGVTVVASDPDLAVVLLGDLSTNLSRGTVQLPAGSEPVQLAEVGGGKIYVALRRSGQVVKIDSSSGAIEAARSVCLEPRGLSYEAGSDKLYVVCASGELATVQAESGNLISRVVVEPDLRDVVAVGDRLFVSRFRSAELLTLDTAGTVLGRLTPPPVSSLFQLSKVKSERRATQANTAWRLIRAGSGLVMLHQMSSTQPISAIGHPLDWAGWGPCDSTGMVTPALTFYSVSSGTAQLVRSVVTREMTRATDMAPSADGSKVYLAGHTSDGQTNIRHYQTDGVPATNHCQYPITTPTQWTNLSLADTVYAIGLDGAGAPWLYQRTNDGSRGIYHLPYDRDIDWNNDVLVLDPANNHRVFEQPTPAGIACASCHPEGGDDGIVWNFDDTGPRRTKSLRGGLLATAPFHWDGNLVDFSALLQATLVGRMSAQPSTLPTAGSLGPWVDGLPALRRAAPVDPDTAERGRALFKDETVGCATCHSGEQLTNNSTSDVGTGKAFNVPSLKGLWTHPPYMHNGCAKTLRERFDPACGGANHGNTAGLSQAQLDDLIGYLETL